MTSNVSLARPSRRRARPLVIGLLAAFAVAGLSVTGVADATAEHRMPGQVSSAAGEVVIDGINGPPLPILSYGFGVTISGTSAGGGGGAGRAQLAPLRIKKTVDASSPQLFEMGVTGRHIPTVTLRVRKKGQSEAYLVVTMKDVLVSSYQTGGSGGEPPTEEVTFAFHTISYRVDGHTGVTQIGAHIVAP
jgi:type VI secretion system Hcp family effector